MLLLVILFATLIFFFFKSIPKAPDKDLKYVIKSEKRVNDLLKKLKNKNALSEKPILNSG